MRKDKRRRIAVAIIAFILIFMMVVPLLLSMTVYAEPSDYVTANLDDSYGVNSGADEDSSYGSVSSETDNYDEYESAGSQSAADSEYTDTDTASVESGSSSDQAEEKTGTSGNTDNENVCAEGVHIENVDVSGMTRSEVQAVVDQKMKELSSDLIYLYTEMGSTAVSAGSMGLTYENKDIVDQALALASKGDILKRYKADSYIKDHGQIVLDLDLKVDPVKVKERVETEKSVLNIDPVAAGIFLNEDGTMTSTEASNGVKISILPSVSRIVEYMDTVWHGGTGGVNMSDQVLEPEEHKGDLTLVKDVIGTATTDYSGGASGRIYNIEYAASIIDGTIVDPGDTFNFAETVGEQDEEHGWKAAGSIEDGRAVDTYGGGICQVSTTLYLAVLQAELEVTERYPHSMEVNYVEPGLDAAIADDIKNFQFKNNTDAPIYLNVAADGGSLTFNIYGHETRDPSRTIKIESRVIESEDYTTTATLDSSLEAGTVQFSGGQRGLVMEAWKTIYFDGIERSEEQVNTSIYEMIPLTYIIGTNGMDDATLSAVANAVQTGNAESALAAIGW